jgi:hypothetical protein
MYIEIATANQHAVHQVEEPRQRVVGINGRQYQGYTAGIFNRATVTVRESMGCLTGDAPTIELCRGKIGSDADDRRAAAGHLACS